MKAIKYLFLLLFLSLLTSCEKDYISPTLSSGSSTPPPNPNAPVSFSVTIQPIFNASCALSGCHVPPSPPKGIDLSQGNSYNSIWTNGLADTTSGQYATSTLYTAVIPSGNMPEGGGAKLNSNQCAEILLWITQGAQNN
jgi:hypothetical protein